MSGRTRRVVAALAVALLFTAVPAPASAVPSTDPGTGSAVTVPAPAGGEVTVSSTDDLVNQTVHVSWTGFKPSSQPVVFPGSTTYVVRVYQCRGDAPAGPEDCYGSSVYTYAGQTDRSAILPDGPTNHRNAATAADGTGGLDFEVRTTLESSTLGCTQATACSLVVVPNYGDGHKRQDYINATTDHMDSAWAWSAHVAVPLHMAPAGAVCPLGTPGVSTIGSPMLQRAITSWQPAACQAQDAVNIDYTALGETQGRAQYDTGAADAALTTLAADPAPTRPTAYAPLVVSGIAIAYHIDDDLTGQPITDLKLDARLVAKLITESYGGVGYRAPGQPVGDGNPNTLGNPYSIYTDPEFLDLNPGHTWPRANSTNPLLLAGNSDMAWELTRWITSDREARAWLDGADDGHGMHVNTAFQGIAYPASALVTQDPYPPLSFTFVPVNGLDHVARGLVADQPSSSSPTLDTNGQHPKDPQQAPGHRALIAVVDTADAAAFSFPQAELLNAGGEFVGPTTTSLAAGLSHMTVADGTHVRTADFADKDPASYPLTMVQYAMVPTGDVDATKASEIVKFLGYAGGAGQVPGSSTGDLPSGYLPLPTTLQADLTSAVAAVRTQSGKVTPPPPADGSTGVNGAPAGSGYGNGQVGRGVGGAAAPAAVAVPGAVAASGAATAAPTDAAAVAAKYEGTPGPGSAVRLLLPLILIATLVAGLCGPVLIAHGGGVFGRLRRRPGGR